MGKIYTRLLLLLLAAGMSATSMAASYFYVNGKDYDDSQSYSDILEDGGSLSFDASTYTLTMKNCTGVTSLSFQKGFNDNGPTPTIRLIGENTMTQSYYASPQVQSAIYNQYGGISFEGDYTGKLTISGYDTAIKAVVNGEELDGGSGNTDFTVTVRRCDLNIAARMFGFYIPEGTLDVDGANIHATVSNTENGNAFLCQEFIPTDIKPLTDENYNSSLLKTERWIVENIYMGSYVVAERTFGSIERAVSSNGHDLKHVNELYVISGAITGSDLEQLRVAAIEGELERLDLGGATVKHTGDDNLDALRYSKVEHDYEIPERAFCYAQKLKYLMLPYDTKSVGNDIVTETQVERLLMPPYVEAIDIHAFDSPNLKIVDFYDMFGRGLSEALLTDFLSNPPFMYSYLESIRVGEEVEWDYWKISPTKQPDYVTLRSQNGVLYSADMKELIAYPPRHKAIDENGNYTTVDNYDIPETVTNIAGYAFCGNENLSTIVIPESVDFIGYAAFGKQKGYKRIIVPAGVSYGSDNVYYVETRDATGYHGTIDLFLLDQTPATTKIVYAGEENEYADYVTIRVPYQSLDTYKASDNFKDLNVQPMLVGTGETTPFYYDKPVYLSMSDWASKDSYESVDAYMVVGVDEATGQASMLNLNPGNGSMIPANTAVVVKPTRLNGCYPFDILDQPLNGPRRVVVGGQSFDNYLVGVATTTTVQPTEGNRYNYQLDGEKFVLMSQPVEMTAGSVYLQVGFQKNELVQTTIDASDVEDFAIPTHIDNAAALPADNEWRNLNGQRVTNLQHGIYINNGRKVIVK